MTTLVENRQARFQYYLEDAFEAGLMLEGWEVKAIFAGQATFNGGSAFVRLTNGEAWLEGATITPLRQAFKNLVIDANPVRSRKLLLNKAELTKLTKKVAQKGYTIVPLEIFVKGKLKLKIAIGKGKNAPDKRDTVKTRDIDRSLRNAVKQMSKS